MRSFGNFCVASVLGEREGRYRNGVLGGVPVVS
jgi:hypothetical protein